MSATQHFPENPRSQQADDLYARLRYMGRLNELLADRVKPAGQMGKLSRAEMERMEWCYRAGWSAEAFAHVLQQEDAARAEGRVA